MSTLLLRLSAPLQSWGYISMYDIRETDDMPTKSGVIGMVAAALGIIRENSEDSLKSLKQLKFGVRIDSRGTKMDDYQVTDMGEKLNVNISHREYLSDAIFLVGLSLSDEEKISLGEKNVSLEDIEIALKNPVFPLFLGRKSCPPTQPLVLGIRECDLEEALRNEEWLMPGWRQKYLLKYSNGVSLRIIVDDTYDSEAYKVEKKDVPISYSLYKREYGYRYIKEVEPKKIDSKENDNMIETDHDPMAELG